MDVREKLVELMNNSFAEQYEKRGLLTAPHTATDLTANGVTVQEWISVKDMLPQAATPVIVYGGNGISIDWLKDYGEQGLRWGNLCCGSYNAKYWQPMPQPPKGE